jgi:hypothetical protein
LLVLLLNTLAADAAQVDILALGSGLTETRLSVGISADRGLDLARANVDIAGISGLPVRGSGGLLGEREVGLSLGNLLVLGLSHLDLYLLDDLLEYWALLKLYTLDDLLV